MKAENNIMKFLNEYKANGINEDLLENYNLSKEEARKLIEDYYLPFVGNCTDLKPIFPEQKLCQVYVPPSYNKETYEKRKANGVCVKCIKPREQINKTMCDYHLKWQREFSKRSHIREKRKQYAKEYHLRPEVIERTKEYYSRSETKKKRNEYMKEYYQRPEVKEKRRKYAREYYKLKET